MLTLTVNVDEFEQYAAKLGGADQTLFALSRTINDAAFHARNVLVQSTWPQHVDVHNQSFLNAALRVIPSTKRLLHVEIVDTIGRANLYLHAHGGTRTPKHGRHHLTIPNPAFVRRTSHGVPEQQRPRALIANSSTGRGRREVHVTDRGIYVARHGRLELWYRFKPSVYIKRDVPFFDDFAEVMRQEVPRTFRDMLLKAMRPKA